MRIITLSELKTLAEKSKDGLWAAAQSQGREPNICVHWTACPYDKQFDDYHINIDKDCNIYLTEDDLSIPLAHLWHRNTGSVGVTLDCAVGATTTDLGSQPPTADQIETMSKVVCILADAFDLTIDAEHVGTHGEFGDTMYDESEAYGPLHTVERWDLEFLGTDESPVYNPNATDGTRGGDIIRGKANWYRNNKLSASL